MKLSDYFTEKETRKNNIWVKNMLSRHFLMYKITIVLAVLFMLFLSISCFHESYSLAQQTDENLNFIKNIHRMDTKTMYSSVVVKCALYINFAIINLIGVVWGSLTLLSYHHDKRFIRCWILLKEMEKDGET